jgi:hypothetical protein
MSAKLNEELFLMFMWYKLLSTRMLNSECCDKLEESDGEQASRLLKNEYIGDG